MRITGVIPSRFGSTRFPGKSLVSIFGKSMIQRVYEQAIQCPDFNTVIVATDDERIAEHVRSFGGNFMMTSDKHKSGTERCAEVLQNLTDRPEVIINIQGDEPFVRPAQLSLLAAAFRNPSTQIATLKKKISDTESIFNPNRIKVVCDLNGNALYFSRSPIPHLQNVPQDKWIENQDFYKHLGIYAYRSDVLSKVATLPPTSLEVSESLEQLRWLQHGYSIYVEETMEESISIDAPEDLKLITKEMTA